MKQNQALFQMCSVETHLKQMFTIVSIEYMLAPGANRRLESNDEAHNHQVMRSPRGIPATGGPQSRVHRMNNLDDSDEEIVIWDVNPVTKKKTKSKKSYKMTVVDDRVGFKIRLDD